MIKLLDILNEINQETIYDFEEANQEYSEDDDSLLYVEYEFNSSKYPYKVIFYSGEYRAEDKTFDLSFGVNTGRTNKIDTFQMTGEGNVRKILKTVAEIIKEFLYQYEEEVEKIIINPTSEKRRKIYQLLLPELSSDILSKITLK